MSPMRTRAVVAPVVALDSVPGGPVGGGSDDIYQSIVCATASALCVSSGRN